MKIAALLSEDEINTEPQIKSRPTIFRTWKIFRVKWRIELIDGNDKWKHPIILPSRHQLTNLLVLLKNEVIWCRSKLFLQNFERKFWIMNSKFTIKRIIKNCMRYGTMNPTTTEQIVSPTPPEREKQKNTLIVLEWIWVLLYNVDKIRVKIKVIIQDNTWYYLLLVIFYTIASIPKYWWIVLRIKFLMNWKGPFTVWGFRYWFFVMARKVFDVLT